MRKWRFTRPAASPAATVLTALAAALAAHAILLLPAYRTPGDKTTSSTSGIKILNVSSLSSEQRKNFQNWLALHDPAQTARSDSRSGYNAVLERKTRVNVHIEPYKMPGIRSQVKLTGFSPIPAQSTLTKSIPEPVEKTVPERPERTALVFDGSGRKITHSIGRIPERLGSSAPTVIAVTDFGKVSGITVSRSSGSRELDLMALDAVFKMDLKQQTALTFVWPGKGKK